MLLIKWHYVAIILVVSLPVAAELTNDRSLGKGHEQQLWAYWTQHDEGEIGGMLREKHKKDAQCSSAKALPKKIRSKSKGKQKSRSKSTKKNKECDKKFPPPSNTPISSAPTKFSLTDAPVFEPTTGTPVAVTPMTNPPLSGPTTFGPAVVTGTPVVESTIAPIADAPVTNPVASAPLASTNAPVSSTSAPVMVTPSAPIAITSAPGMVTPSAPIATTSAPVMVTPSAPIAITSAPVTGAPLASTNSPAAGSTGTPVASTSAPVTGTTSAPIASTGVPVAATIAPATDAPVATTDAPTRAPVAQILDCSFQNDFDAAGDGSVLVRRVINQRDQTVSVEVEYAGEGWIGVAFSVQPLMVPNIAVIGLPGTGVVGKYDLQQRALSGVTSLGTSTLTSTSITQANGITTLAFTKPLVDPGEPTVVPGENRFNWAVGSSNELAIHANRASVLANFDECIVMQPEQRVGVRGEVCVPAPPNTDENTLDMKIFVSACAKRNVQRHFC